MALSVNQVFIPHTQQSLYSQDKPVKDVTGENYSDKKVQSVSSEPHYASPSSYEKATEYLQSQAVKGPSSAYADVQNFDKKNQIQSLLGISLYV